MITIPVDDVVVLLFVVCFAYEMADDFSQLGQSFPLVGSYIRP